MDIIMGTSDVVAPQAMPSEGNETVRSFEINSLKIEIQQQSYGLTAIYLVPIYNTAT